MKRKSSIILISICLLLAIISLPFFGACAKQATGPITLKAVTALPIFVNNAQPFNMLMEKVNARSNGELVIEYLGGEEVIPVPDQGLSVSKGVIDMSMTFSPAYEGLLPGITIVMGNSMLTPWEEREQGVVEYLQEVHAKVNLYYLGRGYTQTTPGEFYWTWSTKKISKPTDFAGMRIGGISPLYNDFFAELGAVVKPLPIPDVYTSLERGVIDGFWIAFTDVVDMGLAEVLPFMIDHGYGSDNNAVLVNLDTWNGLPKRLQNLMTECMAEVEVERAQQAEGMWVDYYAKMKETGMEFIKFSPADAEYFVNLAANSIWDKEMEKYPDVVGPFKELVAK